MDGVLYLVLGRLDYLNQLNLEFNHFNQSNKRFDIIFPPDWGMLRRSRRVLIYFSLHTVSRPTKTVSYPTDLVGITSKSYRERNLKKYTRKTISIWYLCMYGHTYSKNMDQPGKVANPARGQLNKENDFFPAPPVRA